MMVLAHVGVLTQLLAQCVVKSSFPGKNIFVGLYVDDGWVRITLSFRAPIHD